VRDFLKWRQRTLLGESFKVVAPTGQYDPTKLINYGANRWAFKPEFGLSRRWDPLGTSTPTEPCGFSPRTMTSFLAISFLRPPITQKQNPMFAFEGHLSYDVKARLWASLDGNFWTGGRTTLNGVENSGTLQRKLHASEAQSLFP
jgi:hypothetical protein